MQVSPHSLIIFLRSGIPGKAVVILTRLSSRFGYSISISQLPVDEGSLDDFIQKAAGSRNVRAFGMLDAPWSVNASKMYVQFAKALNASARKMLPADDQPVLVFGLNTDRTTTMEEAKFWESHAPIYDQVHVLIYQDHVELGGGNAGKCQSRLPTPRFMPSVPGEQTVQVMDRA